MNIQEGDPVVLNVETKDGKKKFRSRIIKIYVSGFVITEPLYMGKPLELEPGWRIEGSVIKKDAVYTFVSIVLYSEIINAKKYLIIAWPDEWGRIQRRSDVRLETRIPVEIWSEEEVAGRKFVRLIEGHTRDLSAGGAKIETKEKVKNEQVSIILFLPNKKINLPAQVLRSGTFVSIDSKTRRTTLLNWISLKFLAITEEEKQTILRFIFQKQQELRFKGLI